jgi:sulfide:quinone oxidoreductase
MKNLADSFKLTKDVIPPLANWIKDKVESFDAKANKVTTRKGDVIEYDFMVVAAGLKLRYDLIPGLEEALAIPKGQVCSIYSPQYVDRTFEALKNFRGGNLICTFPNTSVKCPGAPQKICYIAEEFLRKSGKRKTANIFYNTSLANIFGVKYYADALWPLAKKRNITVNLRTNLVEVLANGRQAVFENLDTNERTTVDVSEVKVKMSNGANNFDFNLIFLFSFSLVSCM